VVLDFFSTECPPCEALASKYAAVAEQFAGKAKFPKIFRQGNRELAQKLSERFGAEIARLGNERCYPQQQEHAWSRS